MTPPTVLTIAGSDSGGGAGLQADLRTLFACGVHGMTAVTAVTVQNTIGVTGIVEIPAHVVADQIEVVAVDIGVQAAKTGMLANAEIIVAVAGACDRVGIGKDGHIPFIVDPVCASMGGDQLLRDDALDALRTELFPRATLVTPNLDEVRLLTGIDVTDRKTQEQAADALLAYGPEWALVKAGHMRNVDDCVDLLSNGTDVHELPGPRFDTGNTHGSGDTLASATASQLAQGVAVPAAVAFGKRFIVRSVRDSYSLGKGHGPVSPFWRLSSESV
ncbi:bifunctional hydroxymethylpyrimidine kinase/phosphomethylpyrimidine kinase [Actinocrispum wychmicini]|uniref:Hydroxymethylpyrimidine/phosphomethylpyrimidine kinase n=1 Tax=Actinocrispum wychmicini TaxID=1213861 RepID=A0A4R2JN27_9PSEU|nr:bifunctional hydroxymethylpyrimidine kinase/phosphomethylpyrimidine kinase [Actinocrispum wychmicini]TCO58069.1 hydroxymethylpyrimidine/phosphomethylpyrimidine kinase [Actinocrispum wychmicini]